MKVYSTVIKKNHFPTLEKSGDEELTFAQEGQQGDKKTTSKQDRGNRMDRKKARHGDYWVKDCK